MKKSAIMLQKFLIFIILWLLFQLLIEINCQGMPFKPAARMGHTATLIENKLYILNGVDGTLNPNGTFVAEYGNNDFFYLDVSVPFNTQNLSWKNLTNINTVPPHSYATSVRDGANNSTLLLYG